MFRVEKRFTFPMGHRLSKHKGACFNVHGHNYIVNIGMASPQLDKNDMVIDFSALKNFMEPYFDKLDHAIMINTHDEYKYKLTAISDKVITIDTDPTAERMAEHIFFYINDNIDLLRKAGGNEKLFVEYVTVYESEGSKATFSRG